MKASILTDRELAVKLPSGMEDFYPLSDIENGMVYYSWKYPDRALYHDQFVYQLTDHGFESGIFRKALELMIA